MFQVLVAISQKFITEKKHGPMLTQKCGDVINTQQAGRSEWNETRDLLGFNTEPADYENSTTCQSI